MSIPRDVTEQAKPYLDRDEILIFTGPRQAGKTTILCQLEAFLQERGQPTTALSLEDPDVRAALNRSPKRLFAFLPPQRTGRHVVFLDEVQYLDDPSHFLKYLVDAHREALQLCVSGSSAFYLDRKFSDSLVGRKRLFSVRTCSFREFLRFRAIEDLLPVPSAPHAATERDARLLAAYEEYCTYGGYPRVVLAPPDERQMLLHDIAYSYVKKDVFEANIRQEETFFALLKILARQVGNLVNTTECSATLGASKPTLDHYLAIMERSFHTMRVRPFHRNVRKELTRMPKCYFLDLGLRNFFADRLVPFRSRDDIGPLLENAVYRQLLERCDSDEIRFWRTADQHEVDFVVGERAAYEVKAGSTAFRPSRYRAFTDAYPAIPLTLVTLDAPTRVRVPAPLTVRPWEV